MNTNNDRKLSGKVAIVTGGSQGIGASIAKHLAAAGASVVVNYSSNAKSAVSVLDSICSDGGRAALLQADVSQSADVARLFSETENVFGRPDILVNNAGVYELARVDQITEEQFHRQFNLNVLGIILTTQAAVKHFGSEGGSINNIGSVVSTLSPAGSVVYNATKSAVDALTKVIEKPEFRATLLATGRSSFALGHLNRKSSAIRLRRLTDLPTRGHGSSQCLGVGFLRRLKESCFGRVATSFGRVASRFW